MGLFRKKKKTEIQKTEIETKFENKGQQVGLKTGQVVQKSINKANELKVKYNADDKIEKVKNIAKKVDQKVDEAIEVVVGKTKEVVEKAKKKVNN